MIISHRHKFIFIKTNKTAGTSIEIALSQYCGQKDVLTRISPKDQALREELGYPGPQNNQAPLWDYGLKELARLATRGIRKARRFTNHMAARDIRELVSDEVWSNYYKFCFERNPWDRLISYYYWENKHEPRPSILEYIQSGKPSILSERGIGLYTIDGEVVVDRVCRFERLEEDLEAVRLHVGLPQKLQLPRTKAGHRKDRRSYQEILGPEEQQRIGEQFSREIALFGYEF